MRIYVRSDKGKVMFSVWSVDIKDKQILSPKHADQWADILKYHARAANGERLPFKYHILDTHPNGIKGPVGMPSDDLYRWSTIFAMNDSGSIFATDAHHLLGATPRDLCRWVKIRDGSYVFCEYAEREGKFLGFTTVNGVKCAIIDIAI